ncbi:ATP-binding cassette sub-family G member 5 [Schistocerca gregaria]|uniref:ATP-binding cassette sub-family G member 5 n=1 Tax=Schistocerca gregaria TaxID=7010 RepID=UPI00211E0EB9|nr:ATP-binding cassette sub-family G member 5 [Schistocerca gregaria]
MNGEHCLELCNVFHTGHVEPGTCMQRLMGNVKTGIILKDVSLEVHGGEVLAVLGSKGSGKRALLEVISRRAQGPTRGQILLNGMPMSLRLFQQSCGYVTHKCDLLPAITVEQTLYYAAQLTIGSKISHYVKASRVKQVMADLALTQVANRGTQYLTPSEYRRLMIGVQLVRDPILLLLDEPTWDLDPLNTYLIISILSNHARKYGRIVVLTMEKPRSDVFPFLDRVMYLCLGDVVYTGGTRLMLDYFRSIGFPCPELENPLMYYLCLSTVDRRSRERFIESNHQIAALVEKFKIEGGPFRKSSSSTVGNVVPDGPDLVHGGVAANSNKVPLSAFGRPGCLRVMCMLYMRCLATTFNLKRTGVTCLALRLLALPIFHFLLWIFYSGMQDYQRTFITRNGLVFNCIAGSYVVAIIVTACTFPPHRTRYYQEAQEGLYSGPLFLLCYLLYSLPFSAVSVAAASRISFELIGIKALSEWLLFGGVLWACFLLAEQQTIAILMTVCSSFRAAVCSLYISTVYLILGSGVLRSFHGLPDWLLYLTYATQSRYAGAFLSQQIFTKDGLLNNLPYDANVNCTSFFLSQSSSQASSSSFVCRYANGMAFLSERYGKKDGVDTLAEILDRDLNFGVVYAFSIGLIIINALLYLVPLPAFVKAKFRE